MKEEDSQYKRDTLPPSPDKARIIESAINREVLTLLDSVGEESDPDADDPEPEETSAPPGEDMEMERLEEGVQYRIVEPASKIAGVGKQGGAGEEQAAARWNAALEKREKALRELEAELREQEERLLQREVVLGGREKIMRQKEERLHKREVSLRNWEARLMDREASLREDEEPDAGGELAEAGSSRTTRTSELKIEIPGGTGAWEMVEEEEDDSEDGS